MTQPSRTGTPKRSSKVPIIAAIVAGVLLIVGIRYFTTRDDEPTPGTDVAATDGQTAVQPPRDGCTTVNIAASSEKAALMGEIANSYRDSGRTVDGKCFDIAVTSAASGTAESNLAAGWDETLNGPSPDVWTPAASTWVSLLKSDLTAKDRPNIVPATSESVTSTPLVLAMPEPMAKALGWPDAPIGWADVLALATDPQGWASKGHPEWGKFTLGKTNPNVSTSGLAATIGTLVAATGTSSDLTQAALQKPEVQQYLKDVESSVVHYGDTTLTYLSAEDASRRCDLGMQPGIGVWVDVGQYRRCGRDAVVGQQRERLERRAAVFQMHHHRGAGCPVRTADGLDHPSFEGTDRPVVDTRLQHPRPDRLPGTCPGRRRGRSVRPRHPVLQVGQEAGSQFGCAEFGEPVVGAVVRLSVMVHLEHGSAAFEVLALLADNGVPAAATVLAHIDRNPDPGLHAEIAAAGAYLGRQVGQRRVAVMHDGALHVLQVLLDLRLLQRRLGQVR